MKYWSQECLISGQYHPLKLTGYASFMYLQELNHSAVSFSSINISVTTTTTKMPALQTGEALFFQYLNSFIQIIHYYLSQMMKSLSMLLQKIAPNTFPFNGLNQFQLHWPKP